MKKELTSARLRNEFAMGTRSVAVRSFIANPTVEVKTKKLSIRKLKRAAMYVALSLSIGSGIAFALNATETDFDGNVEATICWSCQSEEGVYKTPKAAIKAVNPDASDREVSQAESQFRYINDLPQDLDYSYFLKAGEYNIPKIK
jgi:hypothetical protein